jgi:hypothetical protein
MQRIEQVSNCPSDKVKECRVRAHMFSTMPQLGHLPFAMSRGFAMGCIISSPFAGAIRRKDRNKKHRKKNRGAGALIMGDVKKRFLFIVFSPVRIVGR